MEPPRKRQETSPSADVYVEQLEFFNTPGNPERPPLPIPLALGSLLNVYSKSSAFYYNVARILLAKWQVLGQFYCCQSHTLVQTTTWLGEVGMRRIQSQGQANAFG